MRISEITANSVHISWHYDGPPSEAVEFVIQYKPKLASDHLEVVGLKTNYYTVQALYPFTEYEFYVVAVSAIGRGLASTATFVTTGETGIFILCSFSFDYLNSQNSVGVCESTIEINLSTWCESLINRISKISRFLCVCVCVCAFTDLLLIDFEADPTYGGPSKLLIGNQHIRLSSHSSF